jgi:hypothetical protein
VKGPYSGCLCLCVNLKKTNILKNYKPETYTDKIVLTHKCVRFLLFQKGKIYFDVGLTDLFRGSPMVGDNSTQSDSQLIPQVSKVRRISRSESSTLSDSQLILQVTEQHSV